MSRQIDGYGAGRDGHDRDILYIHQERSIDQSDAAPTAGSSWRAMPR
jgi:hypothetical protein